MGELIYLHERRPRWREVATIERSGARFHAYVNDVSGEAEFVIINDEGEAVRMVFDAPTISSIVAQLRVKP